MGVCMKKIIDQEISYDKAFHYHCLKNCLRQLLEFNCVKDAFLYVDVSCDFILHKVSFTKYQTQMSAPYQNLWEPFHKYLERKCFDDEEESVSYVRGLLYKGQPVIVAVDSFFLSYRNTYQKYHGSHAIILTDFIDNQYQLIDWYEPHFYKGFLSEELLRKARGSKNQWDNNPFSGQEIKRATYLLNPFTKEYDSERVFLYGVFKIYQTFYKKRVSFTNGNIFYGLDAFIELAKMIPNLLTDNPVGRDQCRKLHNDIFILYISRKLQYFYFYQYLVIGRMEHGTYLRIEKMKGIVNREKTEDEEMKSREIMSEEIKGNKIEKEEKLREENLLSLLPLLLSDYERVLFLIMKNGVKWSNDNISNIVLSFESIRRKEDAYGKSLLALYECKKGDCDEISI